MSLNCCYATSIFDMFCELIVQHHVYKWVFGFPLFHFYDFFYEYTVLTIITAAGID